MALSPAETVGRTSVPLYYNHVNSRETISCVYYCVLACMAAGISAHVSLFVVQPHSLSAFVPTPRACMRPPSFHAIADKTWRVTQNTYFRGQFDKCPLIAISTDLPQLIGAVTSARLSRRTQLTRCIASTWCRLGQISNNVPGKNPVGIFEEKGANNFF